MSKKETVTLGDRLQFGYVMVKELAALKIVAETIVYRDIKAGRLRVLKRGRATRIFGPDAMAYVPSDCTSEKSGRATT